MYNLIYFPHLSIEQSENVEQEKNKALACRTGQKSGWRFTGQSGLSGQDDLVPLVGVDGRGGSGVHRRVAADVGRLQWGGVGQSRGFGVGVGGRSLDIGGLRGGIDDRGGSLNVGGLRGSIDDRGSSLDISGLRGSVHDRGGGLDVGRLLDRRRHDGLLNGWGVHRLGDLLVVVLGEALVRVAGRDGLLDRADVRHRGLLYDALLVGDLLLRHQGRGGRHDGRVGQRAGVDDVSSWSSGSNSENSEQHHQSEHFGIVLCVRFSFTRVVKTHERSVLFALAAGRSNVD
uniref:Uncharacterized protein n=1 Tax=Anopheles atroparvus TaxID=41427 RepID=A0AAG5DG64_ANOAO